ncbi:MAG: adenylate/guanylate cyclase domain-containing protein [SAR324 cluster bacterium]|nr:adenylate/guanylate cyclase domain-containing protein [SAR324 cluster bacterium]
MALETLIDRAPCTTKWLIENAKNVSSPPDLINGFMAHLNQDGFCILRSNTSLDGLHPEISACFYRWKLKEVDEIIPLENMRIHTRLYEYENSVITEIFWGYQALVQEAYKAGPWYDILEKGLTLRRRIQPDETEFELPIFEDFQKLGVTDYFGFPIRLKSGARNGMTLATNKAEGFSDLELELIKDLAYLLMLHIEPYQEHRTTRTLLATYLGTKTGERVLNGQIRRGDVEKMESAIWFSDLRGFTQLSNQIPSEDLIQILNLYFHEIATIIDQFEGEILKFIGDAVLAIFPVTSSSSPQDVCYQALEAAKKVNIKLATLNQSRIEQQLPILNHGIGLHIGTVQYGNIGALDRLDFTVIGQAVNLASRTEGLCSKLEKKTLTSQAFAEFVNEKLDFEGEFELKGFTKNQCIYSLK